MQPGSVAEQSGLFDHPLRPGAIGMPEHRAHQLLDHQDGDVGQRHLHLDREGDQCGEATPAFEPGQMLGGHDRGLARDHCIATGMDAPRPCCLDAEATDMIEPFDDHLEVAGTRCFRPVAYPRQRRTGRCSPDP